MYAHTLGRVAAFRISRPKAKRKEISVALLRGGIARDGTQVRGIRGVRRGTPSPREVLSMDPDPRQGIAYGVRLAGEPEGQKVRLHRNEVGQARDRPHVRHVSAD